MLYMGVHNKYDSSSTVARSYQLSRNNYWFMYVLVIIVRYVRRMHKCRIV